MKRVKLIIAYDGTNYYGWQTQPNAVTVEQKVNEALQQLLKEEIKVIGASRTDSGVHAMGNVAVFDTDARMPAEKFSYALNQRLPDDIRVQKSEQVADDFHPRHCNCRKTYEYRILNTKFPVPMYRLYSHFLCHELDVDRMREAATHLVGTHDFKSFCSTATQVEDTVRTIYSIDLEKAENGMVTIRIRGNGFLYNMVRIIAGTLIQVGLHSVEPEELVSMLEAKNRASAGPTAPANGLTLVNIEY